MLLLQVTPQGQQLFDELKNNPQLLIHIDKILYSNLYQPMGDAVLSNNTLYGTTQEGFLLFGYKMLLNNWPTLVVYGYVDRIMFSAPDWIPRSFGLYTDTGVLLCYGNVKPTDYEVGLLTKSGIIFLNEPISVVERIVVSGTYSNQIDLNRFVIDNLKNKESNGSCPVKGQLYNHFGFDSELRLYNYGIKAKLDDGTLVRVFYDEDNHVLVGEVVQ